MTTTAREELIAIKAMKLIEEAYAGPQLLTGINPNPRIPGALLQAIKWVNEQIILVRSAPPPNEYATATDDQICGEILRVTRLKGAKALEKSLIEENKRHHR